MIHTVQRVRTIPGEAVAAGKTWLWLYFVLESDGRKYCMGSHKGGQWTSGELRSYIAGIHGTRSGRQTGRRIAGSIQSALRTDTSRAGGSWPCKFCWDAIHRRGCDWTCGQMKVNQPSKRNMEDPRAEPKVLAWEEDNIGTKNRYILNQVR